LINNQNILSAVFVGFIAKQGDALAKMVSSTIERLPGIQFLSCHAGVVLSDIHRFKGFNGRIPDYAKGSDIFMTFAGASG